MGGAKPFHVMTDSEIFTALLDEAKAAVVLLRIIAAAGFLVWGTCLFHAFWKGWKG